VPAHGALSFGGGCAREWNLTLGNNLQVFFVQVVPMGKDKSVVIFCRRKKAKLFKELWYGWA
jgi:hypothetical protein